MTIHEMNLIKQEFGYSYEQIAEGSGVPYGTVQKILSGTTQSPRRETVRKLSDFFSALRRDAYDAPAADAGSVREAAGTYGNLAENGSAPGHAPDPGEILRLDRQGTYTLDDYYALPDDVRFELIDGVLYEMNAPSFLHQKILSDLHFLIYQCIQEHASNCEVLFSPFDVQLDRDARTMVQPDLLVFCDHKDLLPSHYYGAPDLVVEVLSPSSRSHDMVLKCHKYLAAGVREYWVIDPENREVIVHVFEKGHRTARYPFEAVISIAISEGQCSIDFNEINRSLARYES